MSGPVSSIVSQSLDHSDPTGHNGLRSVTISPPLGQHIGAVETQCPPLRTAARVLSPDRRRSFMVEPAAIPDAGAE